MSFPLAIILGLIGIGSAFMLVSRIIECVEPEKKEWEDERVSE